MSGKSGFGISISATDSGASAVIDKLNKGIQSLTASGERTGKALEKFGEVSGINKLNEGMQGLRRTATDTFRAIDQTGSSLGSLIAPLTIAGVVELTRRWGAFGQGMTNMAHRLNLPVEALSRLENAARLAGVPAQTMTSALGTLQEKLYGAAWNTDPAAVHILRDVLKIDPGTPGHVRNTAEALDEVAAALQKVGDPHTRQAILDALGIDRAMLPYLENYKKFQQEADQTGANITHDQAEHASALKESWDRLALDLEGIYNRILDGWSETTTKAVSATSRWIEANQQQADSIAKIGAAIGALALLKPAAWVLKLLGLSVPAPVAAVTAGAIAGTAAAIAEGTEEDKAAALGFRAAAMPGSVSEFGQTMSYYNPATKEWLTKPEMQQRIKDADAKAAEDKPAEPATGGTLGPRSDAGTPGGNQFAGPGVPLRFGPGKGYRSWDPAQWYHPPGAANAEDSGGSTGSLSGALGLKEGQYDAFRGSIARIESGGKYNIMGGSSGRFAGKYQMGADEIRETAAQLGERAPTQQEFLSNPEMQERFFERYTLGHHQYLMAHNKRYAEMSPEEQAGVLGYAHNQGAVGASRWLTTGVAGRDAFHTSGTRYSDAIHAAFTRFGTAGDGASGAGGRQTAEVQGHVQVDVHLRGAPPGTQANVTTTGQVRAAPPRVETPMPFAA
jgi:hypothetical protein